MSDKKIVLFHGHHGLYHRPYHWIPTNLLFLCSLVVKEGYEVVVIDENDFYHDDSRVDSLIKEALFCGASVTTGNQITRGIKFSKRVRQLRPDCTIIWGGPHVSALPLESLAVDYIDAVCTGRGELTVLELAKAIVNKSSFSNVPAIFYKEEGKIRRNEVGPVPNLKDMPSMPYSILNIKGYLNPKTKVLNHQASIGCIGSCTFCYWYKKHPIEFKKVDTFFEEIEYLYKRYDLTSIYFDDPDFFQIPRFVNEFLNRLEQSNIRFHWGACSRADVLARYSKDFFQRAANLGLHRIFVGLESGSPKILNIMNKRVTPEQMVKVAQTTKDVDIELYLGMIFGIPGETVDDLILSGELVKKLRLIKSKIGYQTVKFTPYPGLPLTEKLREIGGKLPKTLEEWGYLQRFPVNTEIPFWIQDKSSYKKIYDEYFGNPTPVVYKTVEEKLQPVR